MHKAPNPNIFEERIRMSLPICDLLILQANQRPVKNKKKIKKKVLCGRTKMWLHTSYFCCKCSFDSATWSDYWKFLLNSKLIKLEHKFILLHYLHLPNKKKTMPKPTCILKARNADLLPKTSTTIEKVMFTVAPKCLAILENRHTNKSWPVCTCEHLNNIHSRMLWENLLFTVTPP